MSDARTTFFEEQRRNRRATWRLASASALAVLLMGIPVSIAVTPLVYGVVLVIGEVFHLFRPLPAAVVAMLSALNSIVQGTLDRLSSTPSKRYASIPEMLLVAAFLIGPGVIAMLVLWAAVRTLVLRAAVGGLLLRIGARDPRAEALEEVQLRNLTQEMAIAAGLPAPRVVLLDSVAANAALIGSSDADATIVVSRPLLDDFSREEMQAVVGHLIGSMSNGDLKIALNLASVLQTFGLILTLLEAPFSARARTYLRRLLRVATSGGDDRAEGDLMGALLSETLSLDDDDQKPGSTEADHVGLGFMLLMASVSVKWTSFMFTSAIVAPVLALLWRARRYLADATAVQLTRNPEALWKALAHLVDDGGIVAGSEGATYLFIVGPESIRNRGPARKGFGLKADDRMGTSSFIGFHPPIDRRRRRLEAEGATSRAPARTVDRTPVARAVYLAAMVFVGTLGAVAMAAAFAGVVLFVFLSMFFSALTLFFIHFIFVVIGLLKTALMEA